MAPEQPVRDKFKISLPFNINFEAAGPVARKTMPLLVGCVLVLGGIYLMLDEKLSSRLDKVEISQSTTRKDVADLKADVHDIKTALFTGRVRILSERPVKRTTALAKLEVRQ